VVVTLNKKIAERDQARALRQQGLSINEICKLVSAAKSSISVWVRDVELTEDQKKSLDDRNGGKGQSYKNAIIDLLNRNYTYAEIAKQLGCTKATVALHAKSIGYKYDERKYSRKHIDWRAVQEYYDSGKSWRQCTKDLGISLRTFHDAVKSGKVVVRARQVEGYPGSRLGRTDILQRCSDIERWIAEEKPKAFMCRELACRPGTLECYLEIMGIVYLGNPGSRHKKAEEYLNSDQQIKAHDLKRKLIQDGLKKHCCEVCGLDTWQGQPIPIALHHINGNCHDNRLENLMILCPNCHAQTPNFCGKKRALREAIDGVVV